MSHITIHLNRRVVLSAVVIFVHAAVATYICLGWQVNSRIGLLVYLLFLPLVAMQWLFNRGSSIVTNLENCVRTGHWRDPANPYEGHLFQTLLARIGLRIGTAEIDTVLGTVMVILWLTALFRMVLITP